MKKLFSLTVGLLIFFVLNTNSFAQDVGSILASVADGVKPEAFKGSWDKMSGDWKDKAANLDESDMSGISEAIGGLVGNLKSSAFESGAKKGILGQLTGLSDLTSLKGVLTSLISGLKPSMLKPEFLSKKDNLMKGLEMIN